MRSARRNRLEEDWNRLILIGYARVSTEDQRLDQQRRALEDAGCERIFEDMAGGAAERRALRDATAQLRADDTLTVWRFDRLGRSLEDLIALAESLPTQGIGLRSVNEATDTDSSAGQLVFHLFGALAEFERALVRERTRADLAAARGRVGGAAPWSSTGRGSAR